MKILVCIKQVPGTSNVQINPVTGVLIRDGVECKLNPYDLYALELAMTIATKYGGEVCALSMGPAQAKDAVLEAIYMGAESGYLVSDRHFAGADVLSTSYTLSQAIKKIGGFDLIICGKQTTDGDTAQVGAEISEFLGIPYAGSVVNIADISDDTIKVKVNMEYSFVTEEIPLPCLICTEGDINTPRLPSYKRMKAHRNDTVSVFTFDDFDDKNEKHYGLNGSPTCVEKIFPPIRSNEKKLFSGDSEELSHQLYDLLSERKFI